MAKEKAKCESCGNDKYVRAWHKKMLCSTCQTLWSSINNHPDTCRAAYMELHGNDLQSVSAADGAASVELEYYVDLIDQVSQALGGVPAAEMVGEVERIRKETERLLTDLGAAAVAANDSEAEAARLTAEVKRLSFELGQLGAEAAMFCDKESCVDLRMLAEDRQRLGRLLVDVALAAGAGVTESEMEMLPVLVADLLRRSERPVAEDGTPARSALVPTGYELLWGVLMKALKQAAEGKGRERHATAEPFERQPSAEITRAIGLGYPLGQAMKKARECLRLTGERRRAEILGAIVYLALAYIIDAEREHGAGWQALPEDPYPEECFTLAEGGGHD